MKKQKPAEPAHAVFDLPDFETPEIEQMLKSDLRFIFEAMAKRGERKRSEEALASNAAAKRKLRA